MDENPVNTNSKDGRFTKSRVYTSAETATDSNSYQAEPVIGNTGRTEVNSNEPASNHEQKRGNGEK